MTPEEIQNERLKLAANWFNTLATAIMTAGLFVPAAQFIFEVLPPSIDSALVYGTGGVCVGAGIALHLLGQWTLGGLE
jgi:hypothetical protein